MTARTITVRLTQVQVDLLWDAAAYYEPLCL